MNKDQYQSMYELEDQHWWFRGKRNFIKTLLQQYYFSERAVLKDKKLLLCVSGGMDSVFLYHNILGLQSKYNLKVGMAHVNYNTSVKSDDSM